MSKYCPNCGQKTEGTSCQWCGFPVLGGSLAETSAPSEPVPAAPTGQRIMRGLTWTFAAILAVVVICFVFISLHPDYNLRVVLSESMTPTLKLGDMVLTGPPDSPIAPEIESGAIITYKLGKEMVTHRVVAVEGDNLVTRGDAAEEADPWPVTMEDVDGVHIFTIPKIGWIISFARSSKLGWFTLIILPATVLVALFAKEIVKEALKP